MKKRNGGKDNEQIGLDFVKKERNTEEKEYRRK